MASTASQRRGLAGVGKLRRILRRLPDEATAPLRQVVEQGAGQILATQQALIPKRTGHTEAQLQVKISRDGLTARVGLVTRKAKREGFVACFLEYGTKGYPERNIPPMQPHPFLGPSLDMNAPTIIKKAGAAIRQALQSVSRGGDDD